MHIHHIFYEKKEEFESQPHTVQDLIINNIIVSALIVWQIATS